MEMLATVRRCGVHAAIALLAFGLLLKPSSAPLVEVLETFIVLIGMAAICVSARVAVPRPASPVLCRRRSSRSAARGSLPWSPRSLSRLRTAVWPSRFSTLRPLSPLRSALSPSTATCVITVVSLPGAAVPVAVDCCGCIGVLVHCAVRGTEMRTSQTRNADIDELTWFAAVASTTGLYLAVGFWLVMTGHILTGASAAAAGLRLGILCRVHAERCGSEDSRGLPREDCAAGGGRDSRWLNQPVSFTVRAFSCRPTSSGSTLPSRPPARASTS